MDVSPDGILRPQRSFIPELPNGKWPEGERQLSAIRKPKRTWKIEYSASRFRPIRSRSPAIKKKAGAS